MIIFEKVRYQNFLATGNVPIEIRLNTHTATLIVGRNGAGKSTMTEAVCFALFGRSLRNINKPALINAINKRDMLVELWFRIGEHTYQVRRGMKPTVFEIYQDGVLLPQPAALADYQTQLETLLGLNYKSFMQIVVLGSASYVPFMRLTPAARREIVEDLLDIEIFSYMSGLAKDELTQVKQQSDQLQQQKTLLDEQRRMAESFTAQTEETRATTLAQLDTKIATTTAMITALQTEIATLQAEIDAYAPVQTECNAAQDKCLEYRRTLQAIEGRTKKLIKERAFYETHDDCPTCAQTLASEFKTEKFDQIDKRLSEAHKAIVQCTTLIDKYTQRITEYDAQLAVMATYEREQQTKAAQLPVHQRHLRQLHGERTAHERAVDTTAPVVDMEDLSRRIAETQQTLMDVAKRRSILDTAATLLKDSGIKARLIKHYLPIINKQINTYLTAMDFPIHFFLDEQFQEHMQSLHRDDFSYDSFSEGEKKRIDLALLLTWRAVARLKNSAACNLLVLDEVFDSSLDLSGTEEFLKIIQSLENANIFVISHKTDTLIDKFPYVLTFAKERGFSTLK